MQGVLRFQRKGGVEEWVGKELNQHLCDQGLTVSVLSGTHYILPGIYSSCCLCKCRNKGEKLGKKDQRSIKSSGTRGKLLIFHIISQQFLGQLGPKSKAGVGCRLNSSWPKI